MPEQKRVLSIDGGGIRGLIPAKILAQIEHNTGQKIAQLFDLIVGTSTGGLIVLSLTRPDPDSVHNPMYSAEHIVNLYKNRGREIFPEKKLRMVKTLHNLFFEEMYSADSLEKLLHDQLGDTMLSQALCNVLITSYDIETHRARFFKSRLARETGERDIPMWEAARATSAAPTYFEPFQVPERGSHYDGNALIDGGVIANNPAMCAYVEAMEGFPGHPNLLMVSLGTGKLSEASRRIPYEKAKNWGTVEWVTGGLIDIVLVGSSQIVDTQVETLLKTDENNSYYRFDVDLTKDTVDMDNASKDNIDSLSDIADRLLEKQEAMLNELCENLLVT